MIHAGKLRNRLTIERSRDTRDANGGVTEEWREIGKTWASIEPLKASEIFAAEAADSTITHRVKLRSTLITNRDRFREPSGRILNVSQALPPEYPGGYLTCLCVEATSEGDH